jgi:hypothetical protein
MTLIAVAARSPAKRHGPFLRFAMLRGKYLTLLTYVARRVALQ